LAKPEILKLTMTKKVAYKPKYSNFSFKNLIENRKLDKIGLNNILHTHIKLAIWRKARSFSKRKTTNHYLTTTARAKF